MGERLVKLAGLHDLCIVLESVNYTVTRQFAPVIVEVLVHVKISYSIESDTLEMFSYAINLSTAREVSHRRVSHFLV